MNRTHIRCTTGTASDTIATYGLSYDPGFSGSFRVRRTSIGKQRHLVNRRQEEIYFFPEVPTETESEVSFRAKRYSVPRVRVKQCYSNYQIYTK